MKSILIVGAGEMQVPLIKKAREMGYRAVVTDYDPSAPGFKFADVKSYASTNDKDLTLDLAMREKVSGIVTAATDYPVRTIAHVCASYRLCGLSNTSAVITTNKYFQRDLFRRNNLLTPNFKLIKNENDIDDINDLRYPLIIKPVDSSGSRGVRKINDPVEIKDAFFFALQYSCSGQTIIEEYVEGREFSVECLIQEEKTNIIAITEKFTDGSGGNFFVEEKHLIPARISSIEYAEIENTVKAGIGCTGLNNCAAHVEVKIGPDGIVIIELAGRLGGDYITSHLVPLSTGVDMLKNIILLSLGQNLEIDKTENNYAGVCFLTPRNYFEMIEYMKQFFDSEDLIAEQIKKFNPEIELKCSLDRFGYYIFCTDSKEKILKYLNIGDDYGI